LGQEKYSGSVTAGVYSVYRREDLRMKQVVRIEIKRGTEGMQWTLLDQTVEFKEGSTLYKAYGNSGENFDVVVSMRKEAEYPEPEEKGWYRCKSDACGYMFYNDKDKGEWILHMPGNLMNRNASWAEFCETESDCVGGKGLRKVG
jgi:hypothetical protein